MKLEQAARQIIVDWDSGIHLYEAITALREALAEQSEQGPVDTDFENWFLGEGQETLYAFNTLTDADAKAFAEIAWNKAKQPVQQEPVAWMNEINGFICKEKTRGYHVPLYAAPVRTKDPCNPLQDLTDDEIRFWIGRFPFLLNEKSEKWVIGLARVIIAADREKNK